MRKFDAGVFASTYNEKGEEIWKFLQTEQAVRMMANATSLGRPAVEGVVQPLAKLCGEMIEDRTKQMIGRMVRQIMESYGYVIDRQNVRIKRGPFSSGTRYKKRHSSDFGVVTPEAQKAWERANEVPPERFGPDVRYDRNGRPMLKELFGLRQLGGWTINAFGHAEGYSLGGYPVMGDEKLEGTSLSLNEWYLESESESEEKRECRI